MKFYKFFLAHALNIIFCCFFVAQNAVWAGLAKGTLILTPDGLVAVEDLTLETSVTGYDAENKSFSVLKIKQIRIGFESDFVVISTDLGGIRCSSDHKVYEVMHRNFVKAQNLEVGDILLTSKDESCVCRTVDRVRGFEKFYEISLDDPHIFFSSDAQILTHNAVPIFLAAPVITQAVFEAIVVVGAVGTVAVFSLLSGLGENAIPSSNQNYRSSMLFQSIEYDSACPRGRMAADPPTIQSSLCKSGSVCDGIFWPDEELSVENARASINAYYKTGDGRIKIYEPGTQAPLKPLPTSSNFKGQHIQSCFGDATIKISASTSTRIMDPVFLEGRQQLKLELLHDGNLSVVMQKICVPGFNAKGEYVFEWGNYKNSVPLDRYSSEAKDVMKIIDDYDSKFIKNLVESWPQKVYEEFEWSVGFVDERGLYCNRIYRHFGYKFKGYIFSPLALFQMAQTNIAPSAVLYAIRNGRRKSSIFSLHQRIHEFGHVCVMFNSWDKEVWGVGGAGNILSYEEDPGGVILLQDYKRMPLIARNNLRSEAMDALDRRYRAQALEVRQKNEASLEAQQLAALNSVTHSIAQSIAIESAHEHDLEGKRTRVIAKEEIWEKATSNRNECKYKHLDVRMRYIQMVDGLNQNNRNHILQKHHNWEAIVPDSNNPENWTKIRDIIVDTLMTGPEYIDKVSYYYKLMNMNGKNIEVRYLREMRCCITTISNAFVQ